MNSSGFFLKNIYKEYLIDNEKYIVLENISLDISINEITVIIGESGCGKTTLLRIIAGLEEADSGNIEFIKNSREYKPKVGIVFQESRLMPWLNVSENITFSSVEETSNNKWNFFKNFIIKNKNYDYEHCDKNGNLNTEHIDMFKYLKMMKLDKFKNAYPNELSGGMAQRVSIARALYFNPDMLFMDEPFSSLDYFTRMDMQNEVVNIHETTNKGVVFITHDINEAIKIAKKIIVLTKQKTIEEFEIHEGYDRDLSNEYFSKLKKQILKTLKGDKYNET